jgi:hypothetical protein
LLQRAILCVRGSAVNRGTGRLLRGLLTAMKITTPPLLKMRSVVSEDGRWARFFLLFKTGQNAAYRFLSATSAFF